MNRFLYIFGYAPPSVAAHNRQFDDDFEHSMSFFIIAEDGEKALQYGNTLAEKYLKILYDNPDPSARDLELKSWYNSWLDNEKDWEEWQLKDIVTVREGDCLDIKKIVEARYGLGPY